MIVRRRETVRGTSHASAMQEISARFGSAGEQSDRDGPKRSGTPHNYGGGGVAGRGRPRSTRRRAIFDGVEESWRFLPCGVPMSDFVIEDANFGAVLSDRRGIPGALVRRATGSLTCTTHRVRATPPGAGDHGTAAAPKDRRVDSSTTRHRLTKLAAGLLDPALRDRPASEWWRRWLAFEEACDPHSDRLGVSHRLVERLESSLGSRPLGEVTIGDIRSRCDDSERREDLPPTIAAVLTSPGDIVFIDAWEAVAIAVGGGTIGSDSRPLPNS